MGLYQRILGNVIRWTNIVKDDVDRVLFYMFQYELQKKQINISK